MIHLFLSPHFDDAVLSCGGTIHQLTTANKPVVVQTVMGGVPSPSRLPDSPIVRDLHSRWAAGDDPVQARIREDFEAVTSLRASVEVMSVWLDCVYRVSGRGEALYPTEESLFGELHPDDAAARLIPTIVLPPEEPLVAVYAPLGTGHHVDHQIVRNWGLALHQYMPWVALKFYEEYPYTNDRNAVNAALNFFLEHDPPIGLSPELVTLSEADVQAKVKAIGCYESQISTFWQDRAAMEAATRAALIQAGGGQAGERYWRLVNG